MKSLNLFLVFSLAAFSFSVITQNGYTLKNQEIEISIDSKGTEATKIDYTDSKPLSKGRFGFSSLWADSRFDDVKVWGYKNSPQNQLPKVTASSSSRDYSPENAIDGKIAASLTTSNRWLSSPDQPMPQWLVLDFQEKKVFNKVYILWDSRPGSTLIVKDFLLQYWDGKDWIEMV
jgi:hypothetical protein